MPLDRDKHITRSGDDYVTAFEQLLPQGIAWPRNTNSVLMKVVKGLSQIWGHVEVRASDLLERESDPRIAMELLPDWERNWGLPDLCYYDPSTQVDYSISLTAAEAITVDSDTWRVGGLVVKSGTLGLFNLANNVPISVSLAASIGWTSEAAIFTANGFSLLGHNNGAVGPLVYAVWACDNTGNVISEAYFPSLADPGIPPAFYTTTILPGDQLSIGDRQKALIQRMTIEGAQSREFFIAQAAYIGYKITITEYRPFVVGIDRVGDNRQIGYNSNLQRDQFGNPLRTTTGATPLPNGELSEYPYIFGPPENRYYWTVHVDTARLTWFRVGGGGGQTGIDPHLRISLALDLECLLNRWKPAHTRIIFDYSGLAVGGAMAGTGGTVSTSGNITIPSANLLMSRDLFIVDLSSNRSRLIPSSNLALSPTLVSITNTGSSQERLPPSGNLLLSPTSPTIVNSSLDKNIIIPSGNLLLSPTSPTVVNNTNKPFSLKDWPVPRRIRTVATYNT